MFTSIRPVWAEINLNNLEHNMKQIKKVSNGKDIMAVVKADAYGHGAMETAPVLIENGATKLAVAIITEAMELRRTGIDTPIMILGYTPLDFVRDIVNHSIEQTVYSYDYASVLSREAQRFKKKAKIHIAVDTGMGRIGFLPNEESVKEVYKISKLPGIEIEGVFSHFSSADEKDKEYTMKQIEKFNCFLESLKSMGISINTTHISNSAAIIDIPELNYDAVRPGIITYGYYPSDDVKKEVMDLKKVMTLKTKVIHVKELPKGECISYGRVFQTQRKSIIATLPVGYADGYTRLLTGKAKVIINGKFAPVVGKICMDQCMVDVTDIGQVNVGDEVILLGEQNNVKFDADDIAELLGTINYEVVCMISKRVPRVYIRNGEVIKIKNYV